MTVLRKINLIISKLNIFDSLFFTLLISSVVISMVTEMKNLIFTIPPATLCIIGKYIQIKKRKINILFTLALLSIFVSEILVFSDFKTYLLWITILNIIFLLLTSLVLKNYLRFGKIRSSINFSVFLSTALVVYLLFSVFHLILDKVYGIQVYFTILCEFSILLFLFQVGKIYLSNYYKTGTMLLASGLFCLFQILLSIINEFLYYNTTFTTLIITCHSLALYLLSRFLLKTNSLNKEDIREKYI